MKIFYIYGTLILNNSSSFIESSIMLLSIVEYRIIETSDNKQTNTVNCTYRVMANMTMNDF